MEECLKSHQAAVDAKSGRGALARDHLHEASLASMTTALEIRLHEQLSSLEGRLAERLTQMQQEHAARVERLLEARGGEGPVRRKHFEEVAGLAQTCGDDCHGTMVRESLRRSVPSGMPDSRRGSKESERSGTGGPERNISFKLKHSKTEDRWDQALKQNEENRSASHAMALVSSLGWLKASKPMARIGSSRSGMRSGAQGSIVRDFLEPVKFASTIDKYVRMISFTLVLLNTIYMGVQSSISLACIREGQAIPSYFGVIDIAFAILFLAEIGARFFIERRQFFIGPNARWNAFDCILALTPVLEFLVATLNLSFLRSLKAFRAVRAARMIKVVSFVRDLRLMVASILCSLASLMWAFCLLAFVVYLFSLFLMQSIEVYATDWGLNPSGVLMELYGSLSSAMYTLFCAISGGKDWGDLVIPLDNIWKGYRLVFASYVVFVSFGVLNILTAIFVESAKRIAEIDREIVIQDQVTRDKSTMNEIRRIFKAADGDGDGRLSRRELERVLREEKAAKHLRTLELDINEVAGLFQLLDIDDQNHVIIDEFVIQLMRLKGGAKGLDIQTVLYENKRIFLRLTAMMKFVEKHLGILESAMDLRIHGEGVTMRQLLQSEEEIQKANNFASY